MLADEYTMAEAGLPNRHTALQHAAVQPVCWGLSCRVLVLVFRWSILMLMLQNTCAEGRLARWLCRWMSER